MIFASRKNPNSMMRNLPKLDFLYSVLNFLNMLDIEYYICYEYVIHNMLPKQAVLYNMFDFNPS